MSILEASEVGMTLVGGAITKDVVGRVNNGVITSGVAALVSRKLVSEV